MVTDINGVAEPRARGPRGRRLLVILAGAAVVAATIGVSAVMASEPANTGAGGAIPVDPAFTAFNACMKDHGIDLGTPVVVSSEAVPVTGVTGSSSVTITAGDAAVVPAMPAPIDDATFQAANDACMPILEAAGIKTGSAAVVSGSGSGIASGAAVIGAVTAGGDVSKIAADFTAYAACMRDNGVDMPDPKVDTAAGSVQLSMGGDPSSAAFQAASKTCGAKLPFAPLPVPAQP